jgi:polar amino acid transport system substrate-binding protein
MTFTSRIGRFASFAVFAALLGASASARAQSCEPQKVATKYPAYAGKTVTIAATPTYPPYTYTDPSNLDHLTGLEAELIESALNCAGVKYRYELGAWSAILPTILSGSADVAVGNISYTPERAKQVNFIVFMRNGQSVVVPKGNPKGIKTGTDLCGKTGTTTMGGTSALAIDRQSKACVAAGKPPVQFQNAVDLESAYRQLSNERVDFVMDGTSSALSRIAKEPMNGLAYSVTTDVLAGVVVRKDNDEMTKIVYDGLKSMEAKGTLKSLMAKYGLPENLMVPVEIRK